MSTNYAAEIEPPSLPYHAMTTIRRRKKSGTYMGLGLYMGRRLGLYMGRLRLEVWGERWPYHNITGVYYVDY